jgi:hypothetical protein
VQDVVPVSTTPREKSVDRFDGLGEVEVADKRVRVSDSGGLDETDIRGDDICPWSTVTTGLLIAPGTVDIPMGPSDN